MTPYVAEKNAEIVDCFAARGYRCVAERHAEIEDNYAFSEVAPEAIKAMIRAAAGKGAPQAVVPFCTNFAAAPLAEALEGELGMPVFDAVAAGVWKALGTVGCETGRMKGWGRMFEQGWRRRRPRSFRRAHLWRARDLKVFGYVNLTREIRAALVERQCGAQHPPRRRAREGSARARRFPSRRGSSRQGSGAPAPIGRSVAPACG